MKILAISDTYIPEDYMIPGLASLKERGADVIVRHWDHPTLVDLQQDNLAVEQGGPGAVVLPEDLVAEIETFDVLVVQFAPVSSALIDAATNLKMICVLRGGTENVDVDHATDRGICVLNTPGRLARAVAECAVGMILAEIRNIARAHHLLQEGVWSRDFPNKADIPELGGRTVGLVGYGAIAQYAAQFLLGFDCRVIAFDPYFEGDPGRVELTDLDTVLTESDVISLHARLTEETENLIDAAAFDKMKPNAILVNTARSGLINEAALVSALKSQKIMGAAIDVFDEEPIDGSHPLVGLPNVTITPHLAGSTADGFRNSPKRMAAFLHQCLDGQREGLPVINGVEPTL